MQAPFSTPAKLAAKPGRRKALISLTPLIDVVFILLVFFMLASNFHQWRSLELDTAGAAGEPAIAPSEPFVVGVRGEELLLNGETLSLEQLLQNARARQPADQTVSLQPLGQTSVQQLIAVLDALNDAGIAPLNLVEDPEWQSEASLALP